MWISASPPAASNGINFTLPDGAFYPVAGIITDPSGKNPSTFYPNAYSADGGGQSFFAQAKADGAFNFANVPPGHYDLLAGAPGVTVGRSFDVINADVTGLTVNLGSGTTIKGQLVAQGGALPPTVRVFLSRNPPSNSGASGGYAESAADGLDLSVVLDFNGGTIACNALDPDGQPLKGSGVMLLSADAEKRTNTRYFKLGFTDSKGSFKFQSVIPGDYLMLLCRAAVPRKCSTPTCSRK
jgi:hypothetical protein